MSDSVPSESSTHVADAASATTEVVPNFGIELVEITRPEHALFLAPELRWGAAGHDEAMLYGMPLDRLFGEEANAYVTGALDAEDIATALMAAAMQIDPLVTLPGLADGLMLATPDEAPLHVGADDEQGHARLIADTLHTAEINTLFDFGIGAHLNAAHLHEAWTWDLDKGAWVFDHHA
jgi:hypothetical protein